MRTYGVNLQSSLTRVFSRVLEFSSYPPVSVYGTGSVSICPRSFSWKFDVVVLYLSYLDSWMRICLHPLLVSRIQSTLESDPSLLRHSISQYTSSGIYTGCPSATLLSLTLGPDLPRADEPSPGNLGFLTDRILTCLFVTHTGILTSIQSSSLLSLPSSQYGTLPYH